MRILFISKYAGGPTEGRPTRQYLYSKHLARIEGNEVLLISSRSNGQTSHPKFKGLHRTQTDGRLKHLILNGPSISLGLNIIRILTWIHFEVQVIRCYPLIRSWKPEIVIISSLSLLTAIQGILLKRYLRIPFAFEVRDIYPRSLVEVGRFSRYNPIVWMFSLIEKLAYKEADLLLSSLPNLEPHVNEVVGQELAVKFFPMGWDKGEQDENKSDRCQKAIERLVKSESRLKAGYAGTIGEANALEVALDAFKALDNGDPEDPSLWLLGNGPLFEEFQKRYESCRNIIFLGRFSHNELQPILQNIDIALNTWKDIPLYRYGISPNKWIDYMAAAKPILLSYSGFLTGFVESGIGWVVPAEDTQAFTEKIVELSNRPKFELIEAGKRGRRLLEETLDYSTLSTRLYNELSTLSRKV
jgi:glycosyltransferase involved in cell wall biosynthesis